MREMCKYPDGERLLDRYKDKQMVNELIALLADIYKNQDATFTIPTAGEEVGAQSAKLIEKKGIYLVVHFPDFEE